MWYVENPAQSDRYNNSLSRGRTWEKSWQRATFLLPYYLKVWQRRHAEMLHVRWRLLRSRLDGATYLDPRERYLYPAAHDADPTTTPKEGPSSP
jgi:hypothetical protein